MSCAGLQVAARAGVYAILNHLGFSEFENPDDSPMARLRFRWLPHSVQSIPCEGNLFRKAQYVEWTKYWLTFHKFDLLQFLSDSLNQEVI